MTNFDSAISNLAKICMLREEILVELSEHVIITGDAVSCALLGVETSRKVEVIINSDFERYGEIKNKYPFIKDIFLVDEQLPTCLGVYPRDFLQVGLHKGQVHYTECAKISHDEKVCLEARTCPYMGDRFLSGNYRSLNAIKHYNIYFPMTEVLRVYGTPILPLYKNPVLVGVKHDGCPSLTFEFDVEGGTKTTIQITRFPLYLTPHVGTKGVTFIPKLGDPLGQSLKDRFLPSKFTEEGWYEVVIVNSYEDRTIHIHKPINEPLPFEIRWDCDWEKAKMESYSAILKRVEEFFINNDKADRLARYILSKIDELEE